MSTKINKGNESERKNIIENSSEFSGDDSEDSEWKEKDEIVVNKSKINKRKSPKREIKSKFKNKINLIIKKIKLC